MDKGEKLTMWDTDNNYDELPIPASISSLAEDTLVTMAADLLSYSL